MCEDHTRIPGKEEGLLHTGHIDWCFLESSLAGTFWHLKKSLQIPGREHILQPSYTLSPP